MAVAVDRQKMLGCIRDFVDGFTEFERDYWILFAVDDQERNRDLFQPGLGVQLSMH